MVTKSTKEGTGVKKGKVKLGKLKLKKLTVKNLSESEVKNVKGGAIYTRVAEGTPIKTT
jgi:natural product precursor